MNQEEQEQIDKYLFKQLTEEERTNFLQRKADDTRFKKEVSVQKEVIKSLQSYGNQLLKEKLDEIHSRATTSSKPR